MPPRLGPETLEKRGKSRVRPLVKASLASQGIGAGRPLTDVTTDTNIMKNLTLMLIAGVALPIAVIAQTPPPAPPAEATGNMTATDPATTTTDATTTTTTTATTDQTSNTTAAEPDPADTKAKKKKKKPVEATEPRL